MMRSRIFIVTCLVLAMPAVLYGPPQARANDMEELIEMDLSDLLNIRIQAATKTDLSQLEVPQAITVITREEIGRSGARNLGELMRGYVGANIVRINSSQNMISVRGSNVYAPSQTLLLVDGQPIDTTIFSTTWWDIIPVSLYDIERIDFIRSPGTIYGLNAQNGVINVVTRKAEDKDKAGDGRGAVSAGEQSFRRAYAGFFDRVGKVSYRLSVEGQKMDAFRTTRTKEIVPGRPSPEGEQSFGEPSELMLDTLNLSGTAEFRFHGNPLKLNIGRKNIDTVKGRVPDRLCFNELEGHTEFANLSYDYKAGKTEQNLTFNFSENVYTFLRNERLDTLVDAGVNVAVAGIDYEIRSTWRDNHHLLLGGSYIMESGRNETGPKFFNREVGRESTTLLFLQDEWTLNDKARIYLGGTYSHHYISESSFSPMLAYVYKINDRNVLRVASYTSHRNPNLFQSSMDYDQPTGFVFKRSKLISNPKLDPSRTTSYEIGFRSQTTDNLFFSVDIYRNDVRDTMEWDLIGVEGTGADARPIYQTRNNLDQRVYGTEASVRYVMNKNWSFVNNVTMTSIESHSSDPDYKGSALKGPNNIGEGRYGDDYVPPFIYNLIANFNTSRFHARAVYQYTGEHTWQWPRWDSTTGLESLNVFPVPSYSLVDAYLGYDVTPDITISLEGQNLFDKEHTEWRGDQSYFGRMIWASVTYGL